MAEYLPDVLARACLASRFKQAIGLEKNAEGYMPYVTGGAIGAGVGGLGGYLGSRLLGQEQGTSVRNAILGALLGGGVGATIPLMRDKATNKLPGQITNQDRPELDKKLSRPENKKLDTVELAKQYIDDKADEFKQNGNKLWDDIKQTTSVAAKGSLLPLERALEAGLGKATFEGYRHMMRGGYARIADAANTSLTNFNNAVTDHGTATKERAKLLDAGSPDVTSASRGVVGAAQSVLTNAQNSNGASAIKGLENIRKALENAGVLNPTNPPDPALQAKLQKLLANTDTAINSIGGKSVDSATLDLAKAELDAAKLQNTKQLEDARNKVLGAESAVEKARIEGQTNTKRTALDNLLRAITAPAGVEAVIGRHGGYSNEDLDAMRAKAKTPAEIAAFTETYRAEIARRGRQGASRLGDPAKARPGYGITRAGLWGAAMGLGEQGIRAFNSSGKSWIPSIYQTIFRQ